MSESITILQRMLQKAANLPETAENKEAIKTALTEAIQALEEKERNVKPNSEGDEVGLSQETATEHLLRMIEGRPSVQRERHDDAVMQLAALVDQERQQEEPSGPVGDLARMVRRHD